MASVLIVAVVIPMVQQHTGNSLTGYNENPLYTVTETTAKTVIKTTDGTMTINNTPITDYENLPETVLIMSDIAVFEVNTQTGSYRVISRLMSDRNCTADSENDPDLIYTFEKMHLTITGADYSVSAWYRYLLLPDSNGNLGIWNFEDVSDLCINGDKTLYITGISETYSGNVYGTVGNIAAGQNVQDGIRVYGTASAIYEPVLNGTAYTVAELDTDGGIIQGDVTVAMPAEYSYSTFSGLTMDILLYAIIFTVLVMIIAIITKVIE